jgi:hypothetical protein
MKQTKYWSQGSDGYKSLLAWPHLNICIFPLSRHVYKRQQILNYIRTFRRPATYNARMKSLSLIILIVFALGAAGQEVQHAPTAAQCQADQHLWDYEFIHQYEKLPDVGILQKWNSEMRDCMKVDPQTQLQYVFTVSEIDAETALRMMHFLQRHNMLADFKTEDAGGKR